METRQLRVRQEGGPPVYSYEIVPGVPQMGVLHIEPGSMGEIPQDHAHAHDFLVLTYFLRGGGSLQLGNRQWRIETGDVYVVAPGEVLGVGESPAGLVDAEAWATYFPVDVFGSQTASAFLSWRAHPLLFPFVRGAAGGAQRLSVPPEERAAWTARFETLDRELRQRRDGYQEAALAHLTLLLVDVSRLAADVAGDLRLKDEPLLADVFGYIEAHFSEPISLKDVASAVSLTPGHLTTSVRQKTGRTVQDWIVERRMVDARRLLVETDLGVEEVGFRVGYVTPGYFVRTFRRLHGITPASWRRAGRPSSPY